MVIGNVSSMTSHAATGIDVEAGIDSQTASVPATPSSENALSSLDGHHPVRRFGPIPTFLQSPRMPMRRAYCSRWAHTAAH